ncbi:MAG: mechanosensitive ion channel [Rhodospirillales bacterium]|nr:mechanosensitive ion channel [Rhodospirillales bacterium]
MAPCRIVVGRLLAVALLWGGAAGLAAAQHGEEIAGPPLPPPPAAPIIIRLPVEAPTSPTAAIDPREVEGLIAVLEDPAGRARLIGQLKALVSLGKAQEPESKGGIGANVILGLSERIGQASQQIVAAAAALADIPALVVDLVATVADPEARSRFLILAVKLGAVLGAGFLIEAGAFGLLRRPRRALSAVPNGSGVVARSTRLIGRALIDFLPLVLFAFVATSVLAGVGLAGGLRVGAVAVVNAYVLVRAMLVLAQAALAPDAPALRLIPLADETAHYLVIWVRRFVVLGVVGYFAAEAALLLGLPPGGHQTLLKLVGLIAAALAIIFVLQNRQAVAGWIRGRQAVFGARVEGLRARAAEIWHLVAVPYVGLVYLVWALGLAGGFAALIKGSILTVAIVVGAWAAAYLVGRAIERGFALSSELKGRHPGLEARANRYLPMLHVLLRGLVLIVAGLALLQVWGLETLAWLSSGAGRRLAGGAVTVLLILVISFALWELAALALERGLGGGEDGSRRMGRARTLLPMLRKAVALVLATLAALLILSELGVNIAPLLAGAGAVGLAVGFGSQKLIQDIITSASMLVDDTVAVGDTVRIGEHAGVIENLSIRSLTLRDSAGALHVIPFSAVAAIVNMSKDFSYANVDVPLDYKTDFDQALAALAKAGQAAKDDPAVATFILEPLEILGADKFGEVAVLVKARMKTLPGKHWAVQRALNRQVKAQFASMGVLFGYKPN